jgi:hypothetical protein
MSALGQKPTCAPQKVMSALPPKADMCGATAHVCFGPKADIPSQCVAHLCCSDELQVKIVCASIAAARTATAYASQPLKGPNASRVTSKRCDHVAHSGRLLSEESKMLAVFS